MNQQLQETTYEQAELSAMTREELETLREECLTNYMEAESDNSPVWRDRYTMVLGVMRQKGFGGA